MPVRNKPVQPTASNVELERKIDQAIGKGGSVASEQSRKKSRKESSNFPLRFSQPDMWERIDAARQKNRIPPSINVWINEAILDRLEREGK